MLRRYEDNPTRANRARQIWHVLVAQAYNRQTITYNQLAKLIGFKGAGTMGQMLGCIWMFCDRNNLPRLNLLVVNSVTGVPGLGAEVADRDASFLPAAHAAIYSTNWYEIEPPTEDDLRESNCPSAR